MFTRPTLAFVPHYCEWAPNNAHITLPRYGSIHHLLNNITAVIKHIVALELDSVALLLIRSLENQIPWFHTVTFLALAFITLNFIPFRQNLPNVRHRSSQLYNIIVRLKYSRERCVIEISRRIERT